MFMKTEKEIERELLRRERLGRGRRVVASEGREGRQSEGEKGGMGRDRQRGEGVSE